MSENEVSNKIRIPFHIHPYNFEKMEHAVRKSDNEGRERRYLKGITSGMRIDGHGERMTKNCIKSMQNQANSGNILLYEGQHGVNYTDDIGKLVEAEITPDGDWITLYRLYDEYDGFEKNSKTLEKSDKLWKQVNGIAPYVDEEGNPRPLQKGFSIEGYIPDNGIVEMSSSGKRTIDNVELDGVVVTPRPSYKDSVITAVYKALDELNPEKKLSLTENIRGVFLETLEEEKRKESYYTKRFALEDLLNDKIEKIMTNGMQVIDRLNLLFDEYKVAMIKLLSEHKTVFTNVEGTEIYDNDGSNDVAKSARLHVLKNIEAQLGGFLNARNKTVVKANKKGAYNERYNAKCEGSTFTRRKANN